MDQQLRKSVSFDNALVIARDWHRETMNRVHQLHEELRARDEVIKRLRASIGERYTLEMESRLQKEELKQLKDGIRHLVQHDKRLQHKFAVVSAVLPKIDEEAAIPGNDVVATIQALALATGKIYVVRQPVEVLADILGFLDRFSVDRAEFACRKLRTASASLGPQNLRNLSSALLEVTGPNGERWNRRSHGTGLRGGRRGRALQGLGAFHQRYLNAQDKNTYTISVEYALDPKAMKNGATKATGRLEWSFADAQKATAHFAGLLRNASVGQLTLTGPSSRQFIEALSVAEHGEAAKLYVAVGSLTIDDLTPEAAHLVTSRIDLLSFGRLEKLTIVDTLLDFLSDDFLLAAVQKRVMSIALTSHRFSVRNAGGWGWNGGNGTWQIEAAVGSEANYPELCDGILAFLFREDLEDEPARIELHFPAARVPQQLGQMLLDHATNAKTTYPIRSSFVAVTDVSEELVRYEEYRLLDYGDENGAVYEIWGLGEDKANLELKITTITAVRISEEPGPPPTSWKLIEFRRYRESDEQAQY